MQHLPRHRLPPQAAGADDRTRTGDLVLTKDALYLLSYIGSPSRCLSPTTLWRAGPPLATTVRPSANPLCLLPPRLNGQGDWPASRSSPSRRLSAPSVSAASEGWSGRRGSNPRPTAWKAVTLPLSYSRLHEPWTPRFGGQTRLSAVTPSPTNPPPGSPSVETRFVCLPRSNDWGGWPASRNRPPTALLPAAASKGWWRGEDSNLRRR